MKLNMDQMVSLGNHLLGFVAALLLSWGVAGDLVDLATGVFATIITVSVSIWMNADNAFDAVQSVMRKCLMMVGVFAAGRGWVSAETGTMLVGTIMGLLPVAWSMLFYRDAPGPNFPGTTVVGGAKPLELKEADVINLPVTSVPRDGKLLP